MPELFRELPTWSAWFPREGPRGKTLTFNLYALGRTLLDGRRLDVAPPESPAAWLPFDPIRRICEARNGRRQEWGVGVWLPPGNPFATIRLLDAWDRDAQKVRPWARPLVESLGSYTAVGPSGRGLIIIVNGSRANSEDYHRRLYACEREGWTDGGATSHRVVYAEGRQYVRLTGQRVPGTPDILSINPGWLKLITSRARKEQKGRDWFYGGFMLSDVERVAKLLAVNGVPVHPDRSVETDKWLGSALRDIRMQTRDPRAGVDEEYIGWSLGVGEPPSPKQLALQQAEQAAAAARKAAARTAAAADRPPARVCGWKRFMFHPGKGLVRACLVDCGRWCCPKCARKKKAIWSTHLRDVITFTTVPGPSGKPADRRPRTDPVYLARVRDDTRTTKRITKRIRRAGKDGAEANAARIKHTPGWQYIVSTVPLAERDEPITLTPGEAARQVVEVIRGIAIFGDTRKPISTTRKWKLPPKKPAGWKLINDFPADVTLGEIRQAMEDELAGRGEVASRYVQEGSLSWLADCPLPGPTEEDEAEGLTAYDRARRFFGRMMDRILGLPVGGGSQLDDEGTEVICGVRMTGPARAGP